MAVSDSSAGTTPARAPIERSLAAAVILVRRVPELQVYWVQRSPRLSYLGGFHAFPGGRVAREDAAVPVTHVPDPAEARLRAAAARELFEEIGVLLVRARSKAAPPGLSISDRLAARAALLDGSLLFTDFLSQRDWEVDGSSMAPAGRWVSPPFTPRGFDTCFYLVSCPSGEETSVVPGELSSGEWVDPGEAYRRWERGGALLASPVKRGLLALSELARESAGLGDAEFREALIRQGQRLSDSPEARGGEVDRIEVVPGVVLVPLPSSTIPPATHTNCLVLGEGECLVVDPGSEEPDAQATLVRALERLREEGRVVKAITVTHGHRDHTAGVEALRRHLSVPVVTHPRLVDRLRADRAWADGEILELAHLRGEPWRIEALFTPGHTRDHVAFAERGRGVLVAGDLVSGLGTVVIDPPDGDLGDYLESLRRVADLGALSLFPGHGPPAGGVRDRVEALLEHRQWREDKIVGALRPSPATIDELLPRVYDDVPESQWEWGRRSLLAHLQHLEAKGRARADASGVWRLIP
jgi:ribonuclease/clavin/mitogillin